MISDYISIYEFTGNNNNSFPQIVCFIFILFCLCFMLNHVLFFECDTSILKM